MKKILRTLLTVFLFITLVANAQTKSEEPPRIKADQASLENDFYLSYGLGSMFYITNQNGSNRYHTSGAFIAGYARSMGKIVALGFQASYMSISYPSGSLQKVDNYWQGMANLRFRYYNRPSFCMYSGFGIGVTMTYKSATSSDTGNSYQTYNPAIQATLLGFRVGRAFSFFGEFGIGTNYILNAGISYKFGTSN